MSKSEMKRLAIQRPPGRKLDALVAEKVMGFKDALSQLSDYKTAGEQIETKYKQHGNYALHRAEVGALQCTPGALIPQFSTSITAAWEIVEKLNMGFTLSDWWTHRRTQWSVEFIKSPERFGATGKTVPHAICLAALKAMVNNV